MTSGSGQVSTGSARIAAITPGLFTASSDGQGVAAAIAVHAKPDGSQPSELMGNPNGTTRQIDLGPVGEIVVIDSGSRDVSTARSDG